jgi:hypothetical protein
MDDKDTEQLLAEAEADGYVDSQPEEVQPGDPDWVEPAENVTPVEGD